MTPPLDLTVLRDVAISVAEREDADLRVLGKGGVFDMPELAFAYAVGKEWARRLQALHPDRAVKWQREVGDSRGGITDLVMNVEGHRKAYVEFKMADRREAYLADIQKLRAVEGDIDRVLCLVVDSFDGELDGRLAHIAPHLEPVGPLSVFETKSPRYATPVHCVVGVWTVVPVGPALPS